MAKCAGVLYLHLGAIAYGASLGSGAGGSGLGWSVRWNERSESGSNGGEGGVEREVRLDEVLPRVVLEEAALGAELERSSCKEVMMQVAWLQDATASMEGRLVSDYLAHVVDEVGKTGGASEFALATFRDKPRPPFGVPEIDYCVKVHLSFRQTVDARAYITGISGDGTLPPWVNFAGGGDRAENQLGALWSVLEGGYLFWRESGFVRVVVVLTDAPPHFESDGLISAPARMPVTVPSSAAGGASASFSLSEGHTSAGVAGTACANEYYPSPWLLRDAVQSMGTYIAFLVFDADAGAEASTRPATALEEWQVFNAYLGQPTAFCQSVDSTDERVVAERLRVVLDAIRALECS